MQLSVLEKRRIQAQVIKPIYAALLARLGPQEARAIIAAAIREAALAEGEALAREAPGGRTDLPAFVKLFEGWKAAGALEIEVLAETSTRFEFDVTRCRYAEMYRDMGLEAIGDLLSCQRDGVFVEGYNPAIRLDRAQTIMQGAERCTFRYRVES
ncbi:MAG: 2-amino-thiazoline-4-carboxylic acid hydrolase [Betaproteobacteria bacterium]|nr:2-amino-thiazoline-4-carboxylic acid hydrolase [Betaproteobacteria bacterium]